MEVEVVEVGGLSVDVGGEVEKDVVSHVVVVE